MRAAQANRPVEALSMDRSESIFRLESDAAFIKSLRAAGAIHPTKQFTRLNRSLPLYRKIERIAEKYMPNECLSE